MITALKSRIINLKIIELKKVTIITFRKIDFYYNFLVQWFTNFFIKIMFML